MADPDIHNFKTYAEGEPIPPVDPEDIKRRWNIKPPWTSEALQAAWSHEADSSAVSSRCGMIGTLAINELLTPWQHGEELDDAVFRVAATFPIHALKHRAYKIPGDEHFGFDPNAFVQRLINETGIAHVWKPVQTKVTRDGRCFTLSVIESQDPDTAAKREARQLLWEIWNRFSPGLHQVLAHSDKEQAAHIVATFFADFVIDNLDLLRQVEDGFKSGNGFGGLPILMELERRAQRIPGSG